MDAVSTANLPVIESCGDGVAAAENDGTWRTGLMRTMPRR
jgi:hypothetical protein